MERHSHKAISILVLLLWVLIPSGAAFSNDNGGVGPEAISVPDGPASIRGLGEEFETRLSTGSGTYQVPLELPPGVRGFTPDLNLTYDTNFGNGPFGIGWKLPLPEIRRATEPALPTYDDDCSDGVCDTFTADGADLVEVDTGIYRSRVEEAFLRYERVGDAWEARDRDGVLYTFGLTANARIEEGSNTFVWLLEEQTDPWGNTVQYTYIKDGGQAYLSRVDYAIYTVEILYEARPDAFCSHRSGFAVCTELRATAIEVQVRGEVFQRYELGYASTATKKGKRFPDALFSLLHTIRLVGVDPDTGAEELYPELTLSYEVFDPGSYAQVEVMANPPPISASIERMDTDLADINGDGLPDVVKSDAVRGWTFYPGLGLAGFGDETEIHGDPVEQIGTPGVIFADMDGDALVDVLVQKGTGPRDLYHCPNLGNGLFGIPVEHNQPGFDLRVADQYRTLDLNGDRLMDVMRSMSDRYQYWIHRGNGVWESLPDEDLVDPVVTFANPKVHLADFDGDGLLDLAYIREGHVRYWPNLGYGGWGAETYLSGGPFDHLDEIRVGDLNADGLDDLYYVGPVTLRYWLNMGNAGFVEGTPADLPEWMPPSAAFRTADMNGNGSIDVLWDSASLGSRYAYFDLWSGSPAAVKGGDRLAAPVKPHLLQRVENGIGETIEVEYKALADYLVADLLNGNPWDETIPIPLMPVSRRTVSTGLSSDQVTEFAYRDPTYDSFRRTFCGFGEATQTELGDAYSATTVSRFVFGTGLDGRALEGKVLIEEIFDEGGTLQVKRENTWEVREVAAGLRGEPVEFAAQVQEDVILVEGTEEPKTIRTNTEYDEYGNNTRVEQLGDVDTLGDEIVMETTYARNLDVWILGLPAGERILDGEGSLVTETRNYYDDLATLGEVDHGVLTLEQRWDGAAFVDIRTKTYDAYGNLISVMDGEGGARSVAYQEGLFAVLERFTIVGGEDLLFHAAYDERFGKPVSITDPAGSVSEFAYDLFGRLTAEVRHGDSMARPTISYTYELGDPVSRLVTLRRETSGADDVLTSYSYVDGKGRDLQTRSEAAGGLWRVIDALEYDARGKLFRKYTPHFDPSPEYGLPDSGTPSTTTFFDAQAREVRVLLADGSEKRIEYGPLSKSVYDEEDCRPGSPHENTPTTYAMDGQSRILRTTETEEGGSIEHVTTYAWDPLGNLTGIVDSQGNTHALTFDLLGRMVRAVDPDRGEVNFTYDLRGKVLSRTDARGETITWTYDSVGRPLQHDSDGDGDHDTFFYYDDCDGECLGILPEASFVKGRMAWVEDSTGSAYFSYDARGDRTVTVKNVTGYVATTRTNYDAMGRIVELTYPDGSTVSFTYGAGGEVASIPGYVDAVEYDADAKPARIDFANGVETVYEYDERSRPTGITSTSVVEGLIQDLVYTLDARGDVLAIEDRVDPSSALSASRDLTYDSLYRLVDAGTPTTTFEYVYDPIGNLRLIEETDIASGHSIRKELKYGDGGGGPHALTMINGDTVAYDASGNPLGLNGDEYKYDGQGRLESVTKPDGRLVRFDYDYRNQRVRKTVIEPGSGGGCIPNPPKARITLYLGRHAEVREGELVKYVHLGNKRIAQVAGGSVLAGGAIHWICSIFGLPSRVLPSLLGVFSLLLPILTFIAIGLFAGRGSRGRRRSFRATALFFATFLLISPLLFSPGVAEAAERAVPTTLYLHPDHLGSAQIVTDGGGNVVERVTYDPFGAIRAREGSAQALYTFSGKELDAETGLFYFESRYYVPGLGRFLTPDTLIPDLVDPQAINPYSYVVNNPYRYVDPDGHGMFKDIFEALGLGEIFATILEMVLDSILGHFIGPAWQAIQQAYAVGKGIIQAAISGDLAGAFLQSIADVTSYLVGAGAEGLGNIVTKALSSATSAMGNMVKTAVDGAVRAAARGAANAFSSNIGGLLTGRISLGDLGMNMLEGMAMGAATSAIASARSIVAGEMLKLAADTLKDVPALVQVAAFKAGSVLVSKMTNMGGTVGEVMKMLGSDAPVQTVGQKLDFRGGIFDYYRDAQTFVGHLETAHDRFQGGGMGF